MVFAPPWVKGLGFRVLLSHGIFADVGRREQGPDTFSCLGQEGGADSSEEQPDEEGVCA